MVHCYLSTNTNFVTNCPTAHLEMESIVSPAESLSLDKLLAHLTLVTVQQVVAIYTQWLFVPVGFSVKSWSVIVFGTCLY